MWAFAHLDYLTGRLIAHGTDPRSLTARDWLDLAYSVMVDMPDGMVDRYSVLARSREQLAKPVAEWLGGARPAEPDRATWGRGPQAKAAGAAMIAGGPAPMRPPGAQRPEAWKVRDEPTP